MLGEVITLSELMILNANNICGHKMQLQAYHAGAFQISSSWEKGLIFSFLRWMDIFLTNTTMEKENISLHTSITKSGLA